MPSICMNFVIHQPYRLRRYTIFDLGQNSTYDDDDINCDILLKMARKCYLPANDVMLKLIDRHEGKFRLSYSISGTALDQFEQYAPEVIASFKALAKTGCVEFMGGTYSGSLCCLYSQEEFTEQVKMHSKRIKELFGKAPQCLRNTELIYNNDLAAQVEELGFKSILAEGADQALGWRSPNFVYQPVNCLKIKLLMRNATLSDDVALRFSNQNWDEWPLTAEKYAAWCHSTNGQGEVINMFMDYHALGGFNDANSGVFYFMEALPEMIMRHDDFDFKTPSEVVAQYQPVAKIDMPQFMSWSLTQSDLSSWTGNDMQQDALEALYALESRVKDIKDSELLLAWRRLQTADNFNYMNTRWFADGSDHREFNPYGSPYDAYIVFMNVLADLELHVNDALASKAAKSVTSGGTRGSAKADTAAKSTDKAEPAKVETRAKIGAVARGSARGDAADKDGDAKPAAKAGVGKTAKAPVKRVSKSAL